jgi:glycosyltransferase involved in cell wall biosynthesis
VSWYTIYLQKRKKKGISFISRRGYKKNQKKTNCMKIAHIVCSYPPYHSGMGNVVLQTVDELGKRGHEVEVITPLYQDPLPKTIDEYEEGPVKEQIDYARRITPQIKYGNAARIPEVRKELETFDLVHLHYPFFGTANLVRQWKNRNPFTPLVITYHMDTRAPGWKGLIFKYYNAFWMPKILSSADLIIGSSDDYIEASDAYRLKQQFPKKWKSLPFGVNIERFAPREKSLEILEALEFHADIPTVLFVGGMDKAHYFKGVEVLLKALAHVRASGVEMQAICVGEGELRQKYERTAHYLGLDDIARFVGRVEDEDLPAVYNTSDLLVLPSTSRGEAFGMVLLEAMASGVPVIASDLPGVRSVAHDGGVVVPPGDDIALAKSIIEFFAQSPEDRKTYAEGVRRQAEKKYAWGHIVDTLEIWYQMLVDKSK